MGFLHDENIFNVSIPVQSLLYYWEGSGEPNEVLVTEMGDYQKGAKEKAEKLFPD